MTRIFNRAEERNIRKQLRNIMPEAEVILWSKIRNKGLGYKFRRQYSAGKYIIDFYCPELKIAIEVDGESHYAEEKRVRDQERQKLIESYGFTFLRFTNREIYEKIDGVLLVIMDHIKERTSPTPPCQGGA